MNEWFTFDYYQSCDTSMKFSVTGHEQIVLTINELKGKGLITDFNYKCLMRAHDYLSNLVKTNNGTTIYFVGRSDGQRASYQFIADVDVTLNIADERLFNRPYNRGGAETGYISEGYSSDQLSLLLES